MSSWQNKVVLVTGGSAGLGRAIATEFASAGAKICIAARNADRLNAAADRMRRSGSDVLAVPADITRQEDVDQLIAKTVGLFGRFDVLVNNAGRSARGDMLTTTAEDFREMLDLNFLAVVRMTRAALPHLLAARGHVVNIGSLASKVAARYLAGYPASKFAVAAYSQQLRLELGPKGLHVLLVCPGLIASDGPREYPGSDAPGLPESARKPGGGVKLSALAPDYVARRILRACERRQPELILPARARLLFAISQLWPTLGDWIVKRKT